MIKTINDALYNYLTIKTIYEARPSDNAAKETYEQFYDILVNDFNVLKVDVKRDEDHECYLVAYEANGQNKVTRFPIDAIDCFLNQINEAPERYENYK